MLRGVAGCLLVQDSSGCSVQKVRVKTGTCGADSGIWQTDGDWDTAGFTGLDATWGTQGFWAGMLVTEAEACAVWV